MVRRNLNESKKFIIRIIDLNKQFEAGEISFSVWQSDENWPLSYKQDLAMKKIRTNS